MERRTFLAAAVASAAADPARGSAGASGPGGAAAPTAEQRVFADKAALLDPDAYQYVIGDDWQLTVPPGETWYAVNAWNVRLYDGDNPWYHRRADANAAVPLPAGFTLAARGQGSRSLLYYARPSRVQQDARYRSDPVGLYYRRLERLLALPLQRLSDMRPAGSTPASGTAPVAFPDGFAAGVIRQFDCENGCWLTLVGADDPKSGYMEISNSMNELDDRRSVRFSESVMLPFSRSLWHGIWLGFGNAGGEAGQPTRLASYGSVLYQKLPGDW